MSASYKRLADTQQLGTSAATIVANPSGYTTFVKLITLHCLSSASANETVKIYRVPDSAGSVGTAGTANQIAEIELEPGETQTIFFDPPGLVLEDTNDTIQMSTTTAATVNVSVDGGRE